MSDLYMQKSAKPMLIAREEPAFDSPEFIYELKFDGERCIAYLDPNDGTQLRNKRNEKMLPKVPELKDIHRQVRHRCILDGELAVLKEGKPDFSEIQRRSLMSNPLKIELASVQSPASFVAFDILYDTDHSVCDLPLMDRKQLLSEVIAQETPHLSLSRFIEEKGTAFYQAVEKQDLEGIVAKRKNSTYHMGERTKNWVKCKNLKDEDFVICGYIYKQENLVSLVLGQYNHSGELCCTGHVTMGVSREDFRHILAVPKTEYSPFKEQPATSSKGACWIVPALVCTVKYMEKTKDGKLRQPVFKGLRLDKQPQECIANR